MQNEVSRPHTSAIRDIRIPGAMLSAHIPPQIPHLRRINKTKKRTKLTHLNTATSHLLDQILKPRPQGRRPLRRGYARRFRPDARFV